MWEEMKTSKKLRSKVVHDACQTDKILWYDIVYKLIKLVLVLLVATADVERIFPSMNFVKTS